jgi:hypothetical protein
LPIKRDIKGYIGQHNADFPDYFDMGDSSRSVGLMAMAGSELDQFLLWDLVKFNPEDGEHCFARHPKDVVWKDYKKMSRDQVLCVAAGLHNAEPRYHTFLTMKALVDTAKRGRVNKDVLLPHHKLVLLRAARFYTPLHIEVSGRVLLFLHLLLNAWITPGSEQNQTIAMLSIMPKWWLRLFNKLHPNLEKNIMNYFGGYPWRDQKELGDCLSKWLRQY